VSNAWKVVRILLGALLVGLAVRQLVRAFSDAQAAPVHWHLKPLLLVASALVTWSMYAILILAWRRLVTAWGQAMTRRSAVRIWIVSSLGKYLPGKVWAIAGMAVMAGQAGVAPWVATGAAVLNQALSVAAGAVVVGVTGTSLLEAQYPWIRVALAVLVGVSGAGMLFLMWPGAVERVLALARVRAGQPAAPAPAALLLAAGANIVAWCGYGAALWLLAHGVLDRSPTLVQCIGAFAASYVAGLVAVVAPAGLGVRESVFILMLQGTLGAPGAAALAIASRVMLTITEVGAAVPFLLTSREHARAAS
jgi:uncharacterized membrane protein YbhN (UPF0104 family)